MANPPSVTATHTTTETLQTGPPAQFAIPPPSSNPAPTRSTAAALAAPMPRTDAPLAQPSPAEAGAPLRHGLEHPPGYVQNPYAADGTAAQRARLQAAQEEGGEGEDGVLGQAKRWVESAGEGLKRAEESAWKWVNGPK